MLKRRRALVVLVLLSLCGTAASGGWYLHLWHTPDPAHTSSTRLLAWMAVSDVSYQPQEVQVAVVDRLQDDLMAGRLEFLGRETPLTATSWGSLTTNAQHLKRIWFEARARTLATLPPVQRSPYVLQQIEAVERWVQMRANTHDDAGSATPVNIEQADGSPLDQVTRLALPSKPARSSSASPLVDFLREADRWIDEAKPPLQGDMRTALHGALICWMSHRSLETQAMDVRQQLAREATDVVRASMERARQNAEDETSPSADLWPISPECFTSAQRHQLLANGVLLVEAWFHDLADRYDGLSTEKRFAFLDERLREVRSWMGLYKQVAATRPTADVGPVGGTGAPAPSTLLSWLSTIDGFVERAPHEQQAKLDRFVRDAKQRLAWQSLRSTFNPQR